MPAEQSTGVNHRHACAAKTAMRALGLFVTSYAGIAISRCLEFHSCLAIIVTSLRHFGKLRSLISRVAEPRCSFLYRLHPIMSA